jgi:D-inositol-3-phosphate glycosyltransferase
VAVVPCGVDLDLFRPQDKEAARRALGYNDERIILFVGRIEPLKGIDILINAAAQLGDESDFHVLIVGGDRRSRQQVSDLQDLASDLGIGERVCFLGAVDHEQLPLYYNAADVCVVPSYYESFGLVALEAMACGTPVVASRVGGLTGTVRDGETGYLISWRCPEPFAERLELLLGNETLRHRFGESARETVERYRWTNVAEAVAGLYEELLQREVGEGLQTLAI